MAELKNRRRRTASIVLVAGLTVAGSGVAYAYWTANGTGSGAAQTGEAEGFVVETGVLDGPELSPGGLPGQTLPFTVTNPATGNQRLAAMTVRVANSDGSTWTAVVGCSAADFSVSITDNPAPVTIAPGDAVDGVATITMNNLNANQDACQDVAVPLFFDTQILN